MNTRNINLDYWSASFADATSFDEFFNSPEETQDTDITELDRLIEEEIGDLPMLPKSPW